MGRPRLRATLAKPAPKAQTSPSTKAKSHHHSDRGPSVGGRSILRLQGSAGNRAVANLIERKGDKPALPPQQRDAMLGAAKRMFEQGVDMATNAQGPMSTLVGETGSGMPGTPPQSVFAAIASISAALNVLDAGFHMYESAGGDLSDIPELSQARAHLSTSLYFLKLVQSGAPLAALAQRHVIAAVVAGQKYRVDEAVKILLSDTIEQGPLTKADYDRKRAEAIRIKAQYLGPPGEHPCISI